MMQDLRRTRVTVMTELLALTDSMLQSRGDADALIAGVAKREALMKEFDGLADDLTGAESAEVRQIAKDIMEKDKLINVSLSGHLKEAKEGLSSNMNQQKLLGYTNNAISNSGSYMNYRK